MPSTTPVLLNIHAARAPHLQQGAAGASGATAAEGTSAYGAAPAAAGINGARVAGSNGGDSARAGAGRAAETGAAVAAAEDAAAVSGQGSEAPAGSSHNQQQQQEEAIVHVSTAHIMASTKRPQQQAWRPTAGQCEEFVRLATAGMPVHLPANCPPSSALVVKQYLASNVPGPLPLDCVMVGVGSEDYSGRVTETHAAVGGLGAALNGAGFGAGHSTLAPGAGVPGPSAAVTSAGANNALLTDVGVAADGEGVHPVDPGQGDLAEDAAGSTRLKKRAKKTTAAPAAAATTGKKRKAAAAAAAAAAAVVTPGSACVHAGAGAAGVDGADVASAAGSGDAPAAGPLQVHAVGVAGMDGASEQRPLLINPDVP